MEQTHDEQGEWSVASMAERLLQHEPLSGRLLVGQFDEMAPKEYVQALGDCLQWPVHVVPGVGHAVAVEDTRAWRQDVLEFLGQDALDSLGQDILDILNEKE
jgi:pimeloyl-ACP methyl ester carboxylesterase